MQDSNRTGQPQQSVGSGTTSAAPPNPGQNVTEKPRSKGLRSFVIRVHTLESDYKTVYPLNADDLRGIFWEDSTDAITEKELIQTVLKKFLSPHLSGHQRASDTALEYAIQELLKLLKVVTYGYSNTAKKGTKPRTANTHMMNEMFLKEEKKLLTPYLTTSYTLNRNNVSTTELEEMMRDLMSPSSRLLTRFSVQTQSTSSAAARSASIPRTTMLTTDAAADPRTTMMTAEPAKKAEPCTFVRFTQILIAWVKLLYHYKNQSFYATDSIGDLTICMLDALFPWLSSQAAQSTALCQYLARYLLRIILVQTGKASAGDGGGTTPKAGFPPVFGTGGSKPSSAGRVGNLGGGGLAGAGVINAPSSGGGSNSAGARAAGSNTGVPTPGGSNSTSSLRFLGGAKQDPYQPDPNWKPPSADTFMENVKSRIAALLNPLTASVDAHAAAFAIIEDLEHWEYELGTSARWK